MPTIRTNGLDIAYRTVGSGPPLILLHGASSSGERDFGALLPEYGRSFRCIVPDARGHAGTRWDSRAGFRYEWLVDDLEALADALDLETFHLLGFSMGALTALAFAVRRPERLRTVVLVGITTSREPRASVARRLFDPDRILAREPAWAAELARRHDPVQGPDSWQSLLRAIAADIAGQELYGPAELRAADMPALVVCGDRDPFVPVDHANALRRQLPGGHLLVVPDCGHEVIAERPALFTQALTDFYRGTAATAAARSTTPRR